MLHLFENVIAPGASLLNRQTSVVPALFSAPLAPFLFYFFQTAWK